MAARRESIDRIRQFNRHYVPVMRLLDRSYLDTGKSTLEVAVFIEIGEHEGCSARDIARQLHMDKGYLSRMIGRFVEEGLVRKTASERDTRVQTLALTEEGRARLDELAREGAEIVEGAFTGASDEQLAEVADAFSHVLEILEPEEGPGPREGGRS